MTKPNTFIIGAPKCGTTALSHYLSQHPDVFLGYPKEPWYWSFDLKPDDLTTTILSLDSYLKIYENAETHKIVLDASTRYLYSQVAISEILKFCPSAKFIAMLRNPTELAQAYHMEKVFACVEDELDFETAWNLQDSRMNGLNIPANCIEPKELQYGKVASIGTQLTRLKRIAPHEQIHVTFLEDMAANPGKTYNDILGFLDLAPISEPDFGIIGGAHFHRFPLLASIYQTPPVLLRWPIRNMKKLAYTWLPNGMLALIKRALSFNSSREELSACFTEELRGYFEDEVRQVEHLTARDLTTWHRRTSTQLYLVE